MNFIMEYSVYVVWGFCNHCGGWFSSCDTRIFLLLKSDKSSGKKPHQFYSFLSMFNLLNCFWHHGTFSEQDSFVCYQKLPLSSGIKELFTIPVCHLYLSIMCSSVRVPPFPVLQLNIQIMWMKMTFFHL